MAFMIKTQDLITDAIRNPKHPFRQVEAQPDKAHKSRYERRKIREYLRLGDWTPESDSPQSSSKE